MKKRVLSFLMAMLVFVSSPISVHASSDIQLVGKVGNEIMNDLMLNGAKIGNLIRHYCETFGLWLSYDKWGDGLLFEHFNEYIQEKALIETSETYEDYLRSHLSVGEDGAGEPTLIADSDMMNTLYDFSQDLIKSCGWYEAQTVDYKNYPATNFSSKSQYDEFIKYCEDNIKGTDNVVVTYGDWSKTVVDDSGESVFVPYKRISEVMSDVQYYSKYDFATDSLKRAYVVIDWSTYTYKLYCLTSYGIDGEETANIASNDVSFNKNEANVPITDGTRTVRVYKTMDDLKTYSVGQRPYYMTTEYNNYNSTVDNSTTITQTTIDNSIAYGDVYNYITNNYENSDSLTEDQLRDILDDYLDELKNNQNNDSGSGSGSSGSDDSNGSGGGLGSFLTGLGSLGDAILGILGKLIEYIGKAVDLIVNGISGIIEKIPTSITSLMATAFPFLPEEFFTAIELALILGVVCVVIKIFK